MTNALGRDQDGSLPYRNHARIMAAGAQTTVATSMRMYSMAGAASWASGAWTWNSRGEIQAVKWLLPIQCRLWGMFRKPPTRASTARMKTGTHMFQTTSWGPWTAWPWASCPWASCPWASSWLAWWTSEGTVRPYGSCPAPRNSPKKVMTISRTM